MSLTFVWGTNDPHVTTEDRTAMRRWLQAYDIPATFRTFDGGHRLDEPLIRALADDA